MALKLKKQRISVSHKTAKILDRNPLQKMAQVDRPLQPQLQPDRVKLAKTELTEQIITDMIVRVSHGLSFEYAATALEVNLDQLREWLHTGAFIHERLTREDLEISQHEALCYRLFTKLRKSKVEAVEMALLELLSSSDWKAKAWFLEKTGGELFIKRETVKIEMGTTPMNQSEYDLDQLSLDDREHLARLLEKTRVTQKLLSATVVKDDVGSEVVEVETDSE